VAHDAVWPQGRLRLPAGCWAIGTFGSSGELKGPTEAALASDHDPTPEDLKLMENLERELSDFALAVKDGRA